MVSINVYAGRLSKICPRCNRALPHSCFGSVEGYGLRVYCKTCSKAYSKDRYWAKRPGELRPDGMKFCPRCFSDLPVSMFGTASRGSRSYCRECERQIARERYSLDPDSQRASSKRYRYRISKRVEQIIDSIDRCMICDSPFESERKKFIDHNHANGNIRGVLCPRCNTGLGMFRDSEEIMLSAIHYIKNDNIESAQ